MPESGAVVTEHIATANNNPLAVKRRRFGEEIIRRLTSASLKGDSLEIPLRF